MSDKNKTPEEDYLDSLLRSITGGNEVEEELLDDNFITEDMGKSLLNDCLEIKRILIASINTAKENTK
jgi:hypothetical protein